ncbi:hypothetical protein QTP88_011021 [Uroleucon formosanum]
MYGELAILEHRDFGKINVETIQTTNEGNFRELLRYRACGNLKLKTFLEGPGERNKYVSRTSQNAIIDCCNTVILNKIVAKINKGKCFTVLADETTDVSAIEDFNGTINSKILKRNCATRWIERFHSVHNFNELLEYVIDSSDTISSWADGETLSQANNLENSILQEKLIISLLVLSKIFAVGLPLSKQFQSVAIDLREAMVLANANPSELKTIRSNINEYFHDIYTKASTLAQELIRIVHLFINEIESRFIEHQKTLKGFQNLFPKTSEMTTLEKDKFISLIDFYNDDLANNNKDILIMS